MFNFFKSKPKIEFTDRIWSAMRYKVEGICREVSEAAEAGSGVLLIAIFQETLRQFETELRMRGIPFQRSTPLESRGFCDPTAGSISTRVWLLRASQLDLAGGDHQSGGDPDLVVIFVEHHPVHSRDAELRRGIAGLPCSTRIVYHTALDEPLMMRFGGERLRGLMATLGHDDETALEHSMISTSVERAQEKIEKKVRNETEASSAEEWFRFNID